MSSIFKYLQLYFNYIIYTCKTAYNDSILQNQDLGFVPEIPGTYIYYPLFLQFCRGNIPRAPSVPSGSA